MRTLGQQIVWSMVASTLCGVAVVVLGSYLFSGLATWLAPRFLSNEDFKFPSGLEWIILMTLVAIGAAFAFWTAILLTRKIVGPLTSVADSARRIAKGELSTRAVADDGSIGEAALLVNDFNDMAENLERASEGVSRWNALIAHELRTPVTILRGRLQGLAEGVFAPEPALFQSLLKQVEGLRRLVEDLRTVSLVDAGQLDLVVRDVDLAAELEPVIRLMEPALENAGFRLSLNLERRRCVADSTRVCQAVMALLNNALRHANPGELQVALIIKAHAVEIMVCDCGPGLPADFVVQAFEPFQRRAVNERAVGGSGLGLAVTKAVAEAHGGEAFYEARNGGACFRMRFPRRQAASLKHTIRSARPRAAGARPDEGTHASAKDRYDNGLDNQGNPLAGRKAHHRDRRQ